MTPQPGSQVGKSPGFRWVRPPYQPQPGKGHLGCTRQPGFLCIPLGGPTRQDFQPGNLDLASYPATGEPSLAMLKPAARLPRLGWARTGNPATPSNPATRGIPATRQPSVLYRLPGCQVGIFSQVRKGRQVARLERQVGSQDRFHWPDNFHITFIEMSVVLRRYQKVHCLQMHN